MRLTRVYNYFFKSFLMLTVCSTLFSGRVYAQNEESEEKKKATFPEINGYVKYLPSIRTTKDFKEVFDDQLIHNRLNIFWKISDAIHFQGSLRTRLFYGRTVKEFPFYADFVALDEGWLQPSWILLEEGKFLAHTISDRFYIDFSHKKWHLRAGRQRINWGINMVSNPNDLFNTYSFFDFDYEERPGTDALRIQYYASPLNRLEFAYSPAQEWKESVAAGLYAFNLKGYDFQLLSGYFHHRAVMGTGWAGNIKQAGFKGELSFFHDLEPSDAVKPFNLVGAISVDYQFSNGSFLLAEYLYNQLRKGEGQELLFLTQPLRADNLSFSDHAFLMNYRYPLNMRWMLGAATILYPNESGFFVSPSVQWSVKQNLDAMFISQLFIGKESSILGQAGYLLAGSLKWSF